MKRDTEFKAVFWDIGGVIIDMESVRRSHEEFIELLVEEHQIDRTIDESLNEWRKTLGDYFRSREGTKFRSARKGYRISINSIVGDEIPESEWIDLFEKATRENIRLNPGAKDVIRGLDKIGIHVGVISDIDTWEADRILGRFKLKRHFDSITTSEEVGYTKPDRRIFETALGKADVPPERSLMIGDRYKHDIQGGKSVGMKTVAYGAEDGPDIDYRINNLREIREIVY